MRRCAWAATWSDVESCPAAAAAKSVESGIVAVRKYESDSPGRRDELDHGGFVGRRPSRRPFFPVIEKSGRLKDLFDNEADGSIEVEAKGGEPSLIEALKAAELGRGQGPR